MTPIPPAAAVAGQHDVLDVLEALPAGTRTKDDTDRQIADERATWADRG